MLAVRFFGTSSRRGYASSPEPVPVNNKAKIVICSGTIGAIVCGVWIGGIMALHECMKDCTNLNNDNILYTACASALIGGLIGTVGALAHTKQSAPLCPSSEEAAHLPSSSL